MTVKEFQLTLKNELVRRGIDERTAEIQTYKLVKTFTEDDLREIDRYRSPADFAAISESLLEITMISAVEEEIERKKAAGEMTDEDALHASSGTREFTIGDGGDSYDALSKTKATPVVTDKEKIADDEMYLEDGYFGDGTEFTPATRAKFIGLAALTSPLWIICFSLILAAFGIMLTFAFGVIAVFILLALGLVCVGVLVLIVSLVFGFSQLQGAGLGPALFEVGLGFLCFAAGVALAVLSYNLAVRVLPSAVKRIFAFWRYTWHRVGYFINQVKEDVKKS